MILVDTSVWVDHLRHGNPGLVDRLEQGAVVGHPFVAGQLACANLTNRTEVLQLLEALPAVPVATQAEVRFLLDESALAGHGLSWSDLHLLASARLARCPFWTLNAVLASAAERLGILYRVPADNRNDFINRYRAIL